MRLSSLAPSSFLAEGAREDFVFDRFRSKILDKLEKSIPWGKFSNADVSRIITELSDVDPTSTKKYLLWITKQWLGGLEKEDFYKATQYLQVFERARSRIGVRDINLYPDLLSLYTAIAPFLNNEVAVSGKAEQDAEYTEMHSPENVLIVCDNAEFKIVIPKTAAASAYFGKNTQWCTTKSNWFNSYTAKGPLWIILIKRENKRYQFHIDNNRGRSSFMDERDAPVVPKAIFEAYPGLDAAFGHRLQTFLPAIGLSVLSPSVAETMVRDTPSIQLIRAIKTPSDLAIYLKHAILTPENAHSIAIMNPRMSGHVLKYLSSSRVVLKLLDEFPETAKGLLPNQWTERRKLVAAKGISRECATEIRNPSYDLRFDLSSYDDIPLPWSDEVYEQYWPIAVQLRKVALDEIPEKMRTDIIVARVFLKIPTEIAKHVSSVTPEVIDMMLSISGPNYYDTLWHIVDNVPEAKRILPVRPSEFVAGLWAIDEFLPVRDKFPIDGWPMMWVVDAIRHAEITKWSELPARVNRESFVLNHLQSMQGNKVIPAELSGLLGVWQDWPSNRKIEPKVR